MDKLIGIFLQENFLIDKIERVDWVAESHTYASCQVDAHASVAIEYTRCLNACPQHLHLHNKLLCACRAFHDTFTSTILFLPTYVQAAQPWREIFHALTRSRHLPMAAGH